MEGGREKIREEEGEKGRGQENMRKGDGQDEERTEESKKKRYIG